MKRVDMDEKVILKDPEKQAGFQIAIPLDEAGDARIDLFRDRRIRFMQDLSVAYPEYDTMIEGVYEDDTERGLRIFRFRATSEENIIRREAGEVENG